METVRRKSDWEIRRDVLQELEWDSRLHNFQIGVAVSDGIVTLSGTVDGHARRLAAREAAERVAGVVDVSDDFMVRTPGSQRRTDTEIAHAVRNALEWDAFVPDRRIRSSVGDGWVTLEGEVSTLREREDAERAVRELGGVRAVINRLFVTPVKADPARLRQQIEDALARRAQREAERIRVGLENGTVTLEGRVRTWPEKRAALGTIAHCPGVRQVRDRLVVSPW